MSIPALSEYQIVVSSGVRVPDNATDIIIRWESPSNKEGYVAAVKSGRRLIGNIAEGVLDTVGVWKFYGSYKVSGQEVVTSIETRSVVYKDGQSYSPAQPPAVPGVSSASTQAAPYQILQGAAGYRGGVQYLFAPTASVPTTGLIVFDNATVRSIANILINKVSYQGNDMEDWIKTFDVSNAENKGIVTVQSAIGQK